MIEDGGINLLEGFKLIPEASVGGTIYYNLVYSQYQWCGASCQVNKM